MKTQKHFNKLMNHSYSVWQGFFIALVLIGVVQTSSAELTETRKNLLLELVNKDSRYDCKYLSKEEKEFLKLRFHEINKRNNNPKACDYQLLQVGDEATIERYIKEFAKIGWAYRGAPEYSGQARFIEVYAPTMFREEPFVYSESDTPGPPLSYAITYSIVRLLRESPQLRPEVRHWALALSDNENDLPKNRTILRQWWRANEQHFRERNYEAVQPPTASATPPSPADPPTSSPDLPPSAQPPSASPAAPEIAAKNSPLIPSLITALCATLLALAYWLMARQDRPPR